MEQKRLVYDLTIFQSKEDVFDPNKFGVTMHGLSEDQVFGLIPLFLNCEMAVVATKTDEVW